MMTCSGDIACQEPAQPEPEPLEILELNDDCLIKIFSYLSHYELVNVLGTCPKFDEIIHINLRRCKVLNFNFRQLSSDSNLERLLWVASPYLVSIDFSVGYSINSELVLTTLKPITHCTKLKKLTLNYVTMREDYLQLIAGIADHLEKIDFSFCLLTDELMGDFFKRYCCSLKELIVIGNYTFFGGSLVYLRNLKRLIVESHEDFSINLHVIKANNPNAEIVVYEKGRLNIIDINI